MRARFLTLIAAAGLSLGGCAYGGLGLGAGYGDPYGYGGYGYGSPYYGYGYGSPYGYGGFGSPYGYYGSPFGWYDGYYYPGTGYYVYDRDRNRRVMTAAERQHWREVMGRIAGSTTTTATAKAVNVAPRENWSGFNRRAQTRSSEWQAAREQRFQARQQMQSERAQARSERMSTRIERQSSNRGRHKGNDSDD